VAGNEQTELHTSVVITATSCSMSCTSGCGERRSNVQRQQQQQQQPQQLHRQQWFTFDSFSSASAGSTSAWYGCKHVVVLLAAAVMGSSRDQLSVPFLLLAAMHREM
jgi:transcription initiation factor TFIID subunit TAF12